MSRRMYIITAILAAATGLGAYTATVATRSASQPAVSAADSTEALLSWLNASTDQRSSLRAADADFANDLKRLRSEVAAARAELASTLDKPDATNDQIMAGVEKTIDANNALERRVARYILAVRNHLTVEQQKRLLSLCAEEVRRGRGYQWGRQGAASGTQPHGGHGPHGRGRGGGR